MKKLLLSLLFISTVIYSGYGQLNDYYNRMDHVFSNIDPAKVTSGLLKEFGIRFNEVEAYNGVNGSTNWVDKTQWRLLYSSLYPMRVGTATAIADPTTVFDHLDSEQDAQPNIVLLAALFYNYQQYKTNAYTNGDVTVTNDQIYDVSGRNPYATKTSFGVAPMEYHLEGNSFDFKLQSNMVYTNSSLTLSSVQVDFDNGQGYQTISLNTVKNISYSSGGEKELKVKFVYSGGPTLYSHSKLYVDYVATLPSPLFNGDNIDTEVITGASYQGGTATGDVTIEYAGTDQVLDKPLIVIEGFDPLNMFNYNDLVILNLQ